MTARRYIFVCSLAFFAFSSITIATNYFVDPYLIFGTKRIAGFNNIKADINNFVRTTKAHHPNLGEWDTLLVGNSRIEMGLDPQHPCFQRAGAKVYNMGLPGAGVTQQLGYALNVIYQQPIKQVLVSVDFVDFLIREGSDPPLSLSELPYAGSLRYRFDGSVNPDYGRNTRKDFFRALFSLTATTSSAKTISLQSVHQADRHESGFNPAHDFERAVRSEGSAAIFEQKLNSLDKRYGGHWSLAYSDGSESSEFVALELFLKTAANKNIDTVLFLNPFHEEFWSLLRQHGLLDLYQEWLDSIKNTVERSSGHARLWDFSADSEFIHEPATEVNATSEPLQWFWEPAHYRRELGDKMLDSMLADQCGSNARFGKRIL